MQFTALRAQTVSIGCDGTTNCFLVDPCISPTTYIHVINDGNLGTNNGYTRVISWDAVGDYSSRVAAGDNSSYAVTWNFQPNSTLDSVILKVTYSKRGSTDVVKTDKKAVLIKHMASIIQMAISGAVSSNPTNGSTISVPCGVQSLTINVTTPVTNPNTGVVYSWSLPSGWSGSSTSNTINVGTSAGTGGTILVSAKRNDVLCSQSSYSVSVTRPVVVAPTIAGVSAMCSGDYATLTGNATNATSFSWTTTGAISKLYQSSNYVLVQATSNGYDGTATLTADNECQSPQSVTKTIFVGGPHITSATVNGQSQSSPNYIYNPALLNIGVNNSVGVSYNWTIIQGSGSIYYNGQNSVSAYAYPFVRIEATTSNQCGAGESTTFYLYDISGGYYRMASPNPATNTVSADVTLMGALKTMTLVSDNRSTVVRTFNPTTATNSDTQSKGE